MKSMTCVSGMIVLAAAMAIGGCASPATAKGMTITTADISKTAPPEDVASSLGVGEVAGGSNTSLLDKSKIANDDFQQALVASLEAAQLLSKGNSPRYRVKAGLQLLSQPDVGIDMTVVSNVRYVVTEVKSGRVVFDEVVVTSYTAHLGDAAIGTTRLRLATEGAARKSIATFIEKVNTSKLRVAAIAAR